MCASHIYLEKALKNLIRIPSSIVSENEVNNIPAAGCLALLIYIQRISFTMSPLQQKGGHSETLLNTCIAHSNSADLLLSNNASDWLSGDIDN